MAEFKIVSDSSDSSDSEVLPDVDNGLVGGGRDRTFPYASQFPTIDRPLKSMADLRTWFRELRRAGVNCKRNKTIQLVVLQFT